MEFDNYSNRIVYKYSLLLLSIFYSIPTSSDKLRLVVAVLLVVPLTIAGWVLTPLTVIDEIAPNRATEVGLGGSCRGGPLLA